jgi:hypothetical protein
VLYTELSTIHQNSVAKLNKINAEIVKANSDVIKLDNEQNYTPEQIQTMNDELQAKKSVL